jgi:hypothetical protein
VTEARVALPSDAGKERRLVGGWLPERVYKHCTQYNY